MYNTIQGVNNYYIFFTQFRKSANILIKWDSGFHWSRTIKNNNHCTTQDNALNSNINFSHGINPLL